MSYVQLDRFTRPGVRAGGVCGSGFRKPNAIPPRCSSRSLMVVARLGTALLVEGNPRLWWVCRCLGRLASARRRFRGAGFPLWAVSV